MAHECPDSLGALDPCPGDSIDVLLEKFSDALADLGLAHSYGTDTRAALKRVESVKSAIRAYSSPAVPANLDKAGQMEAEIEAREDHDRRALDP